MFLLTNSWFGRSGSNNSRRAEIKEKFTGEVGKIGKREKNGGISVAHEDFFS